MGERSVVKAAARESAAAARVDEIEGEAVAGASAEAELGVVVREIPVTDIEPDPSQPRRIFDEARLRSLAENIRTYGLLQEPGVVQLAPEKGRTAAYRLIWGERRWRASQLAGFGTLRCKVFPPVAGDALALLRLKERQWSENMDREGLSPIEEAIAIQDAADLERKLAPEVPAGELIEKVAARRGLNPIVARNLVGLLKTPRSLQAAMLSRSIGREVGFELARFWNKLVRQNERGAAKRELHYRDLVAAWARARGLELSARAMWRYAAETYQDPEVVKATCRKAEDAERAVRAEFEAVVERAVKGRWTVAKTKAEVAASLRPPPRVAENAPVTPCAG